MKKQRDDFSGITTTMGMEFEFLICQALGLKIGSHTAGQATNILNAKKLLRELIRRLRQRADQIDADQRLKELLHMLFQSLEEQMKNLKHRDEFANLFVTAMRTITYLLGYDYLEGVIYRNPVYVQSLGQLIRTEKQRRDPVEEWKRRENLLRVRANVVNALKKDGYKDPEIAFVLQTTDYEVKKLRTHFQKSKS